MAAKQLKEQAGVGLTPNFTASDYSTFFLAGALCCTL
jgi:hypothetical protein